MIFKAFWLFWAGVASFGLAQKMWHARYRTCQTTEFKNIECTLIIIRILSLFIGKLNEF